MSLAVVALTAHANASTLYWDGDGTGAVGNPPTAGVGGSGQWDASTTPNWWNGTTYQFWTDTGGQDIADFRGTAGTVTINSGETENANQIIFNTAGYLITGDSTTSIGLTGSGTLTSNAGLSTIATALSGSNLTATGTGTTYLSGVDNISNVTINAGSTLRTNAASLGSSGTMIGGSQTLAGGTLLYYVPSSSFATVGTYSTSLAVTANSTLQFDRPIGNGAPAFDYGGITLGANLNIDAQTYAPDFTYGMPTVNSVGGLSLTANATLNVYGINANATSQLTTFHELNGLTGAYTLTKAGNGNAIIGTGSNYSGLNASAGQITFGDGGGFPTSSLILSGGSVLMNVASTSAITNTTATTVSANSTLSLDQPGASGAGSVNTGPLSIGAQTLTLSTPYPADYYYGAPVFNFSSTTLTGNPTFSVSGINSASSIAFSPYLGPVTGATSIITKTGNATLAIGAGSTYAGLSINAGTVSLAVATAFPTGSISINNGGGLLLSAAAGTTVTNTTVITTATGNAAVTINQTPASGNATYNLGALNLSGGALTVSPVTSSYYYGQPTVNFGAVNLAGNEFYSENGGIVGNNLMATALGPINGSAGSFTLTKTGNANVSILATAVAGATSYYGLVADGGQITINDVSGFPNGALTLSGGTAAFNLNTGTGVTTNPSFSVTLPSKINITQANANGGASYNFGAGTLAANVAIALPTTGSYYYGAPAFNIGATTLAANSTISVTGLAGGSFQLNPTLTSLTGSATLTKNGTANLTIKAAAGTLFSGSAIANSGILQVNAANTLGTTTSNVTVNSSGVYAAGYTMDQPFLSHVVSSSTGVVALAAASSTALDFSSAGANLTNASLGAVGTYTYGGTLTPNGGVYRLGGGGGTLTYSGALATGNSLVVGGALGGTVTLSNAANAFTGGTTINSGTLNVTGSLPSASPLTFGSTATFNETGAATGSSQSLGALGFTAGLGTVTSTYGTSGNTTLTFGSLATRTAGATGNFVVTNGTNGTTNMIALTGQATGFVDQGTFFGGTNYAYYDAGGFVRGISYSGTVDSGAVTSGPTTTVAGTYVQTTGAISAEATNTFTTLNISGAYNFALTSGATVTTNGILKSGANAATISGGTSIKPGSNAELVLRADASGDTLTVSTPIVANGTNALTKSGLGTVTLSGVATYTGATTIDAGTLKLGIANALPVATPVTFSGGAAGATLDLGGFAQTLPTLSIAAGSVPVSQIVTDSGTSAVLTLTSAQTFAGTIQGTAGINFNNSGTLVLSGPNNAYTGGTTVTQGTLQLGAVNALGSGVLTIGSSGQSATVDLNGYAQSVTGLVTPSGTTSSIVTNTSANPATLITGNSANANSFTGVIQDGAGKVSLIVNGSTTTLGGVDTYSGNTTLLGGQLTLASTASIANTPLINISGGILNVNAQTAFTIGATQTLRGMGSVVGKVTVNGTLATGPTTFVAGKSASYLTLGNGSVLAGSTLMDLTAINTSDEIFSSGAGGITLGGTLAVTSPNSIPFAAGQSYNLFSFTTETGTFSSTTLPALGSSSLAWNTASLYTAGTISVVSTGPANLTFNNAGGTGDGVTWDTVQQNFNSGSAVTTFSNGSGAGDNVTFNDVNNGHYNVSIPAVVTPTSTLVSNSGGTYNFSGAGGIGGTGGLTKSLSGALILSTSNSYTGATNVSNGSVTLAVAHALPTGTNLTIAGGASVVASNLGTATALSVGTLGVTGTLDLNNNAMIVHSGTLTAVNTLVKAGFNGGGWNAGSGIISTSASTNAGRVMALGVILNDNGSGTPLYGGPSATLSSTFAGATPVDGDILVKYTYYGDANLSGKVDGSDYSRIDSGFITPGATGWYNGDFNYDGVINGSDYTLIDNAFNSQGTAISSQVSDPLATATAEIAGTSSVPEPTLMGLLGVSVIGLLGRRSRRSTLQIH